MTDAGSVSGGDGPAEVRDRDDRPRPGGVGALDPDTRARLLELTTRYDLGGAQADALAGLLLLLERDPHAPTAMRMPGRAVDGHIADALAGLELAAVRNARRAADIGSGAGLPGLPLAIALPACEVALVESANRKADFVRAAIEALGIANAHAVWARAESWPDGIGAHDLVTARALAAPPIVIEYAAPLLRLGGALVEWRGALSRAEAVVAQAAAETIGLRFDDARPVSPFPGADRHHLYVYMKVRDTPDRFPRRPGMARKRPLSG